jgi:hypothetical protein
MLVQALRKDDGEHQSSDKDKRLISFGDDIVIGTTFFVSLHFLLQAGDWSPFFLCQSPTIV